MGREWEMGDGRWGENGVGVLDLDFRSEISGFQI
jgi:hypothetical protein